MPQDALELEQMEMSDRSGSLIVTAKCFMRPSIHCYDCLGQGFLNLNQCTTFCSGVSLGRSLWVDGAELPQQADMRIIVLRSLFPEARCPLSAKHLAKHQPTSPKMFFLVLTPQEVSGALSH